MIYLAGLVASLGLLLPSSADDGPVKVRRVPSLPDAPELKAAPRAKPVATTAEVPSKPSAPEKKPVIVVKKAQAVDGGPGSPKEEISEEDAQIRQREMALARAMQPKAPAPAPKKKSGRVSWTERYELGPGDTLNFGLHGQPKLAKLKVPVAPDSTISYLQAKQISVRGMTVAELKLRMESVLAEFHRKPKVIVTPAQLGSKKYTVLGKVKSNGTFKLDRPTTLIEAIAKAKGIKVGVRNSNATELADLKRSFVVRDGKKLSVDMASLYRGDMTQDVQIEPGDYIYIASNVHNETLCFRFGAAPGDRAADWQLDRDGRHCRIGQLRAVCLESARPADPRQCWQS